jgi:FdhE protein
MTAVWESRVARARQLAENAPAVGDLLRFHERVLEFQAEVQDGLSAIAAPAEADLERYITACHALLAREGPPELREYAGRALQSSEPLDEPGSAFVAMMLLQPFRELAGCAGHACGVSLLREEADGARRSLVCGLCFAELPIGRIECATCGEQRFDSLAVFAADAHAHLRIEACDTCKSYVLSINVTRCPEAVPVVDDVAALPVHLWAQEQGYARQHTNLFGF